MNWEGNDPTYCTLPYPWWSEKLVTVPNTYFEANTAPCPSMYLVIHHAVRGFCWPRPLHSSTQLWHRLQRLNNSIASAWSWTSYLLSGQCRDVQSRLALLKYWIMFPDAVSIFRLVCMDLMLLPQSVPREEDSIIPSSFDSNTRKTRITFFKG